MPIHRIATSMPNKFIDDIMELCDHSDVKFYGEQFAVPAGTRIVNA